MTPYACASCRAPTTSNLPHHGSLNQYCTTARTTTAWCSRWYWLCHFLNVTNITCLPFVAELVCLLLAYLFHTFLIQMCRRGFVPTWRVMIFTMCCVYYCNNSVSGQCVNYGLHSSNDIYNASCTNIIIMQAVIGTRAQRYEVDLSFCPSLK